MKKNIKVSVIVPIYNVEKFVKKCILSIVNQTHKNLEIILVNDGSEDLSGKICEEFVAVDPRVKVIHKQNAGVSAARNSGIDVATGDYICFVDGDDFVTPDYVEYMLNLAVKNDSEIALTTNFFTSYDEKQIRKDYIEVWSGEEAAEAILCNRVLIGCNNKLFKREFLRDDIRFIPELFIGEGFNFNTYAFQRACKITVGKKNIYYYRKDNPTSAMTKFKIEKCINGLYALEVIKENLIIKSPRILNAWEYANWRTHSDFYDLFVLSQSQKEYPELFMKCRTVTKRKAKIAFKVPTTRKDKIRALVMWICPEVIPMVMNIRKLKYHINVNNR